MSATTIDSEELARLALGSRAMKNRRVRHALIARLLNENGESESEEGEGFEENGDDDRELVRMLITSRMLRRRRVRRALLAHLLRSKGEEGTEGYEGEEEYGEEGGGDENEIVRALIGSRMLRRRRVRRALLAHLLRTKGDFESGEYEGESGDDDGNEQDFVRALIASRALKRRRIRRAILAHLLREREEAVA